MTMFETDIPRVRVITFRVTEEERQAIDDEAEKRGLSLTNLVRFALGELIKEEEE